jgi:hypothetical protein
MSPTHPQRAPREAYVPKPLALARQIHYGILFLINLPIRDQFNSLEDHELFKMLSV